MAKKQKVHFLMQGDKVMVVNSSTGDFIKLFKVNMGYQHDMATFPRENSYTITKVTARNFPYLSMFTS